ncbi:hypothetical protein PR202_gb17775 [Eleusine coracana subsp. coracana]|uniref:DUF569 domain-containing protein n=1 Tax=Eleusine coracana subsp. coracana TaxID=191504 RepID=A0AAV5F591_ELECO|nr:hypothetical protein PR202_gb17775 [Eleusine coracana subsp. coracana]
MFPRASGWKAYWMRRSRAQRPGPAVAEHRASWRGAQPTRPCAVVALNLLASASEPKRNRPQQTPLLCSPLLSSPQRPPSQAASTKHPPLSPPLAARVGEKKRKREALEEFPDGRRVRLRSRGRAGMYLHADEDGKGVSPSPPLPASPLNTVWLVHRVKRGDDVIIRLHGAAYGRYLAATLHPAPPGHAGHRVVQGSFDDKGKYVLGWSPRTVSETDHHVLLQDMGHATDSPNRFLRTNGKYCRWRTAVSVSVDDDSHRDSMLHWVVEAIPATLSTPELPLPSPAARQGGFWNWDRFLGRASPVEEKRTIRFGRRSRLSSRTCSPSGKSSSAIRRGRCCCFCGVGRARWFLGAVGGRRRGQERRKESRAEQEYVAAVYFWAQRPRRAISRRRRRRGVREGFCCFK